MHELGVVSHVIKEVETVAKENNVQKVISLTLEVGEVSTIVPELFKDCFEWSKKRTELMQECELNLVILAAVTYCKDCGETYSTTKHGKTCPKCGSKNTYLITGSEVTIKDIQVE
ncbi:MAG: hydrogenase maturation nickel metallochaperone HypA [Clostridia bacterium]|nr:hydrogenase maturation nickel metallochaperone HypA [Clostridia bacterium]